MFASASSIDHWSALLGTIASAMLIAGALWGTGRWIHNNIVSAVEERLKSIDNAVNHREPGQMPLVAVADKILEDLEKMDAKVDKLSLDLEHHLGVHEGRGDA
jgi:hypothetical protein